MRLSVLDQDDLGRSPPGKHNGAGDGEFAWKSLRDALPEICDLEVLSRLIEAEQAYDDGRRAHWETARGPWIEPNSMTWAVRAAADLCIEAVTTALAKGTWQARLSTWTGQPFVVQPWAWKEPPRRQSDDHGLTHLIIEDLDVGIVREGRRLSTAERILAAAGKARGLHERAADDRGGQWWRIEVCKLDEDLPLDDEQTVDEFARLMAELEREKNTQKPLQKPTSDSNGDEKEKTYIQLEAEWILKKCKLLVYDRIIKIIPRSRDNGEYPTKGQEEALPIIITMRILIEWHIASTTRKAATIMAPYRHNAGNTDLASRIRFLDNLYSRVKWSDGL